MAAVVREERAPGLSRRGHNAEISLADQHARSAQPAVLSPENLGGLCIDPDGGNACEECDQGTLTLVRIARVVHPSYISASQKDQDLHAAGLAGVG
jgi:hypothetical protein